MNFISNENLFKLLETLREEYEVYTPVKKSNQRFYRKYNGPADDIVIGEVRPFEPVKAFFSPAREKVAEGYSPDSPRKNEKPYAIVGVKACDLKGFKIQDHVFKDHDYEDPFYNRLREDNLIISADCTCIIGTCFCLAVGVKPHPQKDFDINLTQLEDGFLAEPGSTKGAKVISMHPFLFEVAKEGYIKQRDHLREKISEEVKNNIHENNVPYERSYKGIVEKNFESNIWEDEAKACVECGACNTICPTCHCFLLYDQKDKQKMARLRFWDSCMVKDFARVAGGANPRERLWMRLRNRFEKKFDFFPKVADIYACTGCGRCISACPAKIDIRKVLRRLVDGV